MHEAAVAGGLHAMVAAATGREPLAGAPGKSGARLERLVIGGERFVLKHMDLASDWTMRTTGCMRGATVELWQRNTFARLPGCFNQPIVAASPELTADGGCLLLMHDVGEWLVPATDDQIPMSQHLSFVRHMAELHAAYWGCGEEVNVVPPMHRYLELSPWMAEAEAAIGSDHLVPRLVGQGWPMLADVAPAAAAVVLPLARDPGPLVEALATTPQTFVHGNFKLDNLGTDESGRTVLLDWELPGLGAPVSDLAWYLAINCRRLPQDKEDTIAAYRTGLEGQGIDTGPWWERQLALGLLGALVQFGWEKALGGYDEELRWWESKAVAAAELLA